MYKDPVTGAMVNEIKKSHYNHDAMIDLIIATPWMRQREIAAHFKVSEAWISIIVNSDSFKAKLEDRKSELIDPVIVQSIEDGFRAVCQLSMNVLQEKLEITRDPKLALGALAVASKALGFGARVEAKVEVNNNWFQQIVQQSGGHTGLIKAKGAPAITLGAAPVPGV